MNLIKIKPEKRTKIAEGSCTVRAKNNAQIIHFTDEDNNVLTSTYATDSQEIKSDKAVYAESTKYPLTIEVIGASAAVSKIAADIITTNTALTANTDKDLETKNALEAKDVDQDSVIAANKTEINDKVDGAVSDLNDKNDAQDKSIADNALANSNLSTEVNDIDTRLADLELNPVNNINTSLPLSFWVGTQDELDLVEDRDTNTVYMVKE